MLKGIFYKEWLKTRWMLVAGFLLFAGLFAYWFIALNNRWHTEQSVLLNFTITNLGNVFHDQLKYLPFLFAVILALFQFIPENKNMRYKLFYMLPASASKLTFYAMLYGVINISIFSALFVISYWGLSSVILPDFIIAEGLHHVLSWLIIAFMAYFFVTAIVVDPTWTRKLLLAIVFTTFTSLILSPAVFGATKTLNLQILPLALCSVALPYYSFYNLIKCK